MTRDPELKALPSGIKVVNFSLATNRVWKDKEEGKKEEVTYHNVVGFGRQAETIAQYMRKGSQILVEGRSQTRSWDNKDGGKSYKTEIVIENVQFGNKPKGAPGEPNSRVEQSKTNLDEEFPDEDIDPADIPF